MRKYWKWILAVVAVLLVGLLVWFVFSYNSVPRLSKEGKEAFKKEYIKLMCNSDMETYILWNPIIWYDENGCVEEDGVWRYIGTYGDCYAFLAIDDNKEVDGLPVEIPYPLPGLSRGVRYHCEARVLLYHSKREFGSDEVDWLEPGETMRMDWIFSIENLEEWITEEQLEQLTQDIEAISKAHN